MQTRPGSTEHNMGEEDMLGVTAVAIMHGTLCSLLPNKISVAAG